MKTIALLALLLLAACAPTTDPLATLTGREPASVEPRPTPLPRVDPTPPAPVVVEKPAERPPVVKPKHKPKPKAKPKTRPKPKHRPAPRRTEPGEAAAPFSCDLARWAVSSFTREQLEQMARDRGIAITAKLRRDAQACIDNKS